MELFGNNKTVFILIWDLRQDTVLSRFSLCFIDVETEDGNRRSTCHTECDREQHNCVNNFRVELREVIYYVVVIHLSCI